ncbi:hypothetical protein L1D50_23260, partial [Pseudoalteromonas sp. Isolate6]|uniref:hypothetical protein n=1 Tax=Pseudoalteromonas sp. Isolate6 TaxID=2908527 RepID=UPI001EFD29B2
FTMFNKNTLFAALSCFSIFSQANASEIDNSSVNIDNTPVKIYHFFNSGVHPFNHTTYQTWGSNGLYCRIQGGSYNRSVPKSGKEIFNVAYGRQMWVLTCHGSMGDQARSVNWTNLAGRFVNAEGDVKAPSISIDEIENRYNVDLSELNLDHGHFDIEFGDLDANSFDDIVIVDKYSKKLYIYTSDDNGLLKLSYHQDSISSIENINSID